MEATGYGPPLTAMQDLRAVLSPDEEYVFMHILFSSSATVRSGSFGLSRKDTVRLLGLKEEDDLGLVSFIKRVNQAVGRYFRLVYDERRERVIILTKVPARQARELLSSESLAILMFIFYHQEVLDNEFTLFTQLVEAFGHETLAIRRRVLANLEPLMKLGALGKYEGSSDEEAYELTAIGSRMFPDAYLKRFAEFSHSKQLNKEDVLKFFKRYNMETEAGR